MLKGIINYFDGSKTSVVIGAGEDVKAPRDLAALEKQGWVIDDSVALTYKAYLAGKRQGDIPADSKFETWVDSVAEIDAHLSRKQIDQAVIAGKMTAEQAEQLLALQGADDAGELPAPPVE